MCERCAVFCVTKVRMWQSRESATSGAIFSTRCLATSQQTTNDDDNDAAACCCCCCCGSVLCLSVCCVCVDVCALFPILWHTLITSTPRIEQERCRRQQLCNVCEEFRCLVEVRFARVCVHRRIDKSGCGQNTWILKTARKIVYRTYVHGTFAQTRCSETDQNVRTSIERVSRFVGVHSFFVYSDSSLFTLHSHA